jgi:hypothetical protein
VSAIPKTIRVDQGSEFISRDLDLWAYQRGVELDFSRPGKPTDNAFIESFNGKFRSECLNAHWFLTLDDARLKMEEWRKDYNTVRPTQCPWLPAPCTGEHHPHGSNPHHALTFQPGPLCGGRASAFAGFPLTLST